MALHVAYNKNKLYGILDYWSTDMLNFDFLEESASSFFTTFLEWFSKKNGFRVMLY